MDRETYFQTKRAQASLLRVRRLRRFCLEINQSPQSKNIHPNDAVSFQRRILTELKKRKQLAYRGPVFLQLEFFNQSKAPPSIYSLSKNYLDLLETPRSRSGIRRSGLLYGNDRQVEALVVRYHLDCPFEAPQVRVNAEPLRDFVADVILAKRVESARFYDDGSDWTSTSFNHDLREGPFPEEEDRNHAIEHLIEFEKNKQWWLRSISEAAYEAHRILLRFHAQQEHLKRTELLVCRELLTLCGQDRKLAGGKHREQLLRLLKASRDMMLAPPFVLELHHAPHREGDSLTFKQAVRTALQAFKSSHPILFPLSSLLSVTILMLPPEGGGKDLDNLARMILPLVHEIWMPPSDLIHALQIDPIRGNGIGDSLNAELAALPKEPKHSVTMYRAFVLSRLPGDPKEGFVRLALGEGSRPLRFREEIDDYLEKWSESLR